MSEDKKTLFSLIVVNLLCSSILQVEQQKVTGFFSGGGHLQILHCPGAGHLPTPGHSRGFDTHAVSYQNNYTEGVTGKNADWLICQGQE